MLVWDTEDTDESVPLPRDCVPPRHVTLPRACWHTRRPSPTNVRVLYTNEGSYSAANSIGRKVLYNSRGLDAISLLVKYYVPLAHINKVIKLLKFKSAMNLQCLWWEGQSRERILLRNLIQWRFLDCASHQKHCKFIADLNFKSL